MSRVSDEKMIEEYWDGVQDDSDDLADRNLDHDQLAKKYGTRFGWGGPEYELDGQFFYAWDDSRTWLYYYDLRDSWQPYEPGMRPNMAQKTVTVRLTPEHARVIYLLATRDESYDWFGKNVDELVGFDGDLDDEDDGAMAIFDQATHSLKDQLLAQGVDLEGPA